MKNSMKKKDEKAVRKTKKAKEPKKHKC